MVQLLVFILDDYADVLYLSNDTESQNSSVGGE